jgi:small GTP-binding protein
MEKKLIRAVIFSQFDEKIGPMAVEWQPRDVSLDIRNLVSLKSIQILAGESGKIPESLAIIPFPSINSKGLVKYLEVKESKKRGGAIDSSLTLLFNESDDLIFYKYIKDFEMVFNETARILKKIEEKEPDRKKIAAELEIFREKMVDTLKKLQGTEISKREPDAFPAELEEGEFKHQKYKLIVCGDPHVGKTSTVLRFTDNAFRRTYIPTIGVNLSDKTIQYKDMVIKFVLWDIAGQSKFQKMRSYFYKGADGLILIFDLTSPESFNNVPSWHKDIKSYLQGGLPGLILGNKNDLLEERKVGKDQGEMLAKKLQFTYFETSALSGENIDEAFSRIAELLYDIKRRPVKKKAPKKKRRTPKKKRSTKKKITTKKKTTPRKKKTSTKKKTSKKKKTTEKKTVKKASKNKEKTNANVNS